MRAGARAAPAACWQPAPAACKCCQRATLACKRPLLSLPLARALSRSLSVKLDRIEGMERVFCQVQGKDRAAVAAVGRALGLEGTYIPHSYIELVQLENLTQVCAFVRWCPWWLRRHGRPWRQRLPRLHQRTSPLLPPPPDQPTVLSDGDRGDEAPVCGERRAADRRERGGVAVARLQPPPLCRLLLAPPRLLAHPRAAAVQLR